MLFSYGNLKFQNFGHSFNIILVVRPCSVRSRTQLLSTAIKTDLRRAVSLRRSSMPAVRSQRNLSIGTYPYSDPHEVMKKKTLHEYRFKEHIVSIIIYLLKIFGTLFLIYFKLTIYFGQIFFLGFVCMIRTYK